MKWTVLAETFWTFRVAVPSVARRTMELFARVPPAGNEMVLAGGLGLMPFPGKRRSSPVAPAPGLHRQTSVGR